MQQRQMRKWQRKMTTKNGKITIALGSHGLMQMQNRQKKIMNAEWTEENLVQKNHSAKNVTMVRSCVRQFDHAIQAKQRQSPKAPCME